MAIPVLPSRSDGLRGIQAVTYVQIQHVEGVRLIFRSQKKIKSRSLFKISRDVKGLFLGFRFASSGVIVSVIVSLQLEDELHVQVGCSVRGVKGLLGLSPLGFISCLLRGKVKPLYIKRGDASI